MKKAFSLIELSIVILIIGILIAGVTQASRMVKEMRLASARTITKSSDVNSIKDLGIWLETTLDGGITSSTNGTQPEDNDQVTQWSDINPQSTVKINLTQATALNRPKYKLDGINGFPALTFDGDATNPDYINTTTATPVRAGNDGYTFVVVWRASAITDAVLMAQGSSATDRLAAIYFPGGGTYGFAGSINDYFPTTVTTNKSYITAMRVDNSLAQNISLYTNSLTPVTGASSNNGPAGLDITAVEFALGVVTQTHGQMYNGLIAEVIVFDRALKSEEIQSIIKYLSKKFSIRLS